MYVTQDKAWLLQAPRLRRTRLQAYHVCVTLRMHVLNSIFPQAELAMRGSNGIGKGPWKVTAAVVVRFAEEKCILGDTCSRLTYTKQAVASSNTNIYNRKSTFFGPDGSSLAWPGPSPARPNFANLGTWKSRNLESKKIKNESSQNPNPFCPKCRQGLD